MSEPIIIGKELMAKPTETRPWGSFTVLDKGPMYQLKRLEIRPKKRISLQKHEFRIEYWTIVQGKGLLTLEGQERKVVLNDRVTVMPDTLHRIENIGKKDLVIIELQMGKDIREDDIVRIEDDYGRKDL